MPYILLLSVTIRPSGSKIGQATPVGIQWTQWRSEHLRDDSNMPPMSVLNNMVDALTCEMGMTTALFMWNPEKKYGNRSLKITHLWEG
jgi:hypothetical protein